MTGIRFSSNKIKFPLIDLLHRTLHKTSLWWITLIISRVHREYPRSNFL